jgi:hypothetical protein
MGGNGMECQGAVVWCFNFNVTSIDVTVDPPVSVWMLGLTMVAMVVVEIWGEVFALG